MSLSLVAPVLGLYRHRHTVRAMGALAWAGINQARRHGTVDALEERSLVTGRLPRFDAALGDLFMRTTGADPAHFRLADGRRAVPPTYYVTWAMAALADALVKLELPYAYGRVLHAGSSVRYSRQLLTDELAAFATRVVAVDDNERRARIRVRSWVTERDLHGPEIFVNDMELFVPKGGKVARDGPKRKATETIIEASQRPLADWRLPADLGRRYALVSGDFNPVHWSRLAARAMGFKSMFVQGYATKAMVAHAIIRELLRGAADKLVELQVEFRRPVFLPATVGLFIGEPTESAGLITRSLAVGRAPGGEALVTGSFVYRL